MMPGRCLLRQIVFAAIGVLFLLAPCSYADGSAATSGPPRTSLDPDVRAVLPFLRPWLLTLGPGMLYRPSEVAANRTNKGKRTLPEPKSYTLTPDPFSWSLASSSPDEDDWAYLPDSPRARRLTTAQRIASAPSFKATVRARSHHLSTEYDASLIGERKVGDGMNFYSVEKEVALGRQLSFEVEQSTRLFTDPVVDEYVNRVGQVLVRHSDCKVPFVIKVIDDDEVNAMALPGGFFYVNTGAILAAQNEAELAGVMAHEIAHVCARHATRNATRGEIAQYASLPLIFLGGPVGFALREVSGMAMPLSFLKFSRDAEREADLLGIQYQYASGYDPTAFVDFFERLEADEKDKPNFVARAFSTHPMNSDRIKRAENMLALLPDRDSYITDTSEFDQVRDRLERLTQGRSFGSGSGPHPTLRRRTARQ